MVRPINWDFRWCWPKSKAYIRSSSGSVKAMIIYTGWYNSELAVAMQDYIERCEFNKVNP